MSTIGPFFIYNNKILSHKLPPANCERRGDKLDNPYSHERLYDDNFYSGEYINIPRGRVVWDCTNNIAIIYIDKCVEDKADEVAKEFNLIDYSVEYDNHYVCPKCMRDIWNH